MAVDGEHGLILAGHATPANRADCQEMMAVVNRCHPEQGTPVMADKGYSSVANRDALACDGLFDLIMYKAVKNRPLSKAERMINRAISDCRGKVERAFGTLEKDYRLVRARYLGSAKLGLQLLMDAMAYNLKKSARMMPGGC